MNENDSGTMGLGGGELRADQSRPAASEPHTPLPSFRLGRNEVDSDARTWRTQVLRSSPEQVHERARDQSSFSQARVLQRNRRQRGPSGPWGERGQRHLWDIRTDVQISEEKHQSGSRRVKRKSGGAECDTWVVLIQAGKQREGQEGRGGSVGSGWGGQEGQQQQRGSIASLLHDHGFTTRPKSPRLRTLAEDRP